MTNVSGSFIGPTSYKRDNGTVEELTTVRVEQVLSADHGQVKRLFTKYHGGPDTPGQVAGASTLGTI